MQLIVHRKTQYFDVARPYKVYVDQVFKGNLRNGETKLFPIEDGKHTVEVKQAVSFFKSKKHEIGEDSASQIALDVSLSTIGIIANTSLFALLFFVIIINIFSLNLGGALFYALPFYLAFMLIAFFGFASRYLTVETTNQNVLLYNKN